MAYVLPSDIKLRQTVGHHHYDQECGRNSARARAKVRVLKSGFLREPRGVFPARHRFGRNLVWWLGAPQKLIRNPYFCIWTHCAGSRRHFPKKLEICFLAVAFFQMGLAKSWWVFGMKIWGQATRTSNFSSIAPKALILQLSEGLRRLKP